MQLRRIIFAFILLSHVLCAQKNKADSLGRHVLREAQKMGAAIISKDFHSLVHYSHPRQVELMGGEEAYFHFLQKNFDELEQGGSKYSAVRMEKVSGIVRTEKEFQCTLTQISEMKVSGGLMRVRSALIAISEDNGKHWYFTDTDGKSLDAMRTLLPSLSDELVLPASAPPEFIQQ